MNEPRDDSPPVRWWIPYYWPGAIWAVVVGVIGMVTPFAIRTVILMSVPDIPEPFDVAEFLRWDVPASEDAFTDYRQAAGQHRRILIALQTSKAPDADEPDDCLALLDADWWLATDQTKNWLKLHQEPLATWRRGTQKDRGRRESPDNVRFGSVMHVVDAQSALTRLAILEAARALSKKQFTEARQRARAMFRCGGHTTYRGEFLQLGVGASIHSLASHALARWAQQPEVTSQQLREALADARSDYALYESPSNFLKAELLIVQNSLRSADWVETTSPPNPGLPDAIASPQAIRLAYWIIGEPELTLRTFRQVIANKLVEIDKPLAKRGPVTITSWVVLFDPDPTTGLPPGQLDPAGIDRAIKHTSLTPMLLKSFQRVEWKLLRQSAQQAALEALLAAQAYRRDQGEFPESLSDLVPKYLESVPIDPCHPTGDSLLYRRDAPTKAVIWSIGEDGKDDGGNIKVPDDEAPDVGFVIQ